MDSCAPEPAFHYGVARKHDQRSHSLATGGRNLSPSGIGKVPIPLSLFPFTLNVMDLIVLGVRFYGGVGPPWHVTDSQTQIGATLQVGAAVKYRLNKNIGPILRLSVGANYLDGEINPTGQVQLGFDFSTRIKPPSRVTTKSTNIAKYKKVK